jgi:surfeit locus 1 family protein
MKVYLKQFTLKWIITTILVLLGSALCVRLGIWQLDRLASRRLFNAHYLKSAQSEPLKLAGYLQDNLLDMDYRPVTVFGVYDFSNNIVLRNQYRDGQSGYFLLTPLILADGSAVLIERGWIPSEGNSSPKDWHKYDDSSPINISGIMRTGQTQSEVGGVPDPELSGDQTRLDFWNLVNLERISKQVPYQLLPVFIQPNPSPAAITPPFPYQPVIEISEGSHFGYALQWFTFAFMLFFGYPFFLRKQLVSSTLDMKPEEFE